MRERPVPTNEAQANIWPRRTFAPHFVACHHGHVLGCTSNSKGLTTKPELRSAPKKRHLDEIQIPSGTATALRSLSGRSAGPWSVGKYLLQSKAARLFWHDNYRPDSEERRAPETDDSQGVGSVTSTATRRGGRCSVSPSSILAPSSAKSSRRVASESTTNLIYALASRPAALTVLGKTCFPGTMASRSANEPVAMAVSTRSFPSSSSFAGENDHFEWSNTSGNSATNSEWHEWEIERCQTTTTQARFRAF